MLLYVYSAMCTDSESLLIIYLQNEYAQILAKRVAEAKAQKTEIRKRRASSMRK